MHTRIIGVFSHIRFDFWNKAIKEFVHRQIFQSAGSFDGANHLLILYQFITYAAWWVDGNSL